MTQDFRFHLVHSLRTNIAKYRDRIALQYAKASDGQDISWTELGRRIEELAISLIASGVGVQEKVAIFSRNSPQWTIADLATLWVRGVTVPIYPTSTDGQTAYIINDADAHIVFVGEQAQLDIALAAAEKCPGLERIVAFDSTIDLKGSPLACYLDDFLKAAGGQTTRADYEQRLGALDMSDLATLIYTSGTTGNPKGVMLDYANLAAAVRLNEERLPISDNDISLCFLPLSHIFERAWTFLILHVGAVNVYMRDQAEIKEHLRTVRPTVMCAVPRLYEKIHAAIIAQVETAPMKKRKMFFWALGVGEKRLQREQQGLPVGPFLKLSHRLADKLVFSRLRDALGGRTRFLPCSGARLQDDINGFFQAIGVNLTYGYGMSETTATVSCYENEGFKIGTMGKPLPEIQIRIGDKGEIQLKAPTIMRGYYNRPDANAESFTEDGWFRTGDAGLLDEQGNLIMTERLKELMKTSNGKYIAPQIVEGHLVRDHLFEQVAVVADARKYVSALIVPAFEALEEYAHSIGVKFEDRVELIRHADIQKLFEERLEKLQGELAKFEQVKKFTLLSREFSHDLGEITPTLKLRRKVIMKRFKKEIEAMYPRR